MRLFDDIIFYITHLLTPFQEVVIKSMYKNIDWEVAYAYLMTVEGKGVTNVVAEKELRKGKYWRVINGIDEQYNPAFINRYWDEALYVSKLPFENLRKQGILSVIKKYYYDNYWLPSGANDLPSPYNIFAFDAHVQGQHKHLDKTSPELIIQARIDDYNTNSQTWNRQGWIQNRMRVLAEYVGANKRQIKFAYLDSKNNPIEMPDNLYA